MPNDNDAQLQSKPLKHSKEDVHTNASSSRGGLMGWVEATLRKFRRFAFFLVIAPIFPVYAFCVGFALSPGYFLVRLYEKWSGSLPDAFWAPFVKLVGLAGILGMSFLAFCVALIFIVPFCNALIPLKPKTGRGGAYSLETVPWYWHNALTYLVRYTILELMTPSPLSVLFFRMMGMKIGKGVILNTSAISDPCLITIEDYVTVGGSATLMAHYGMKGYLVISTLHIKKGATIGLKASLMGDVVIGENATVKPHTVVLPKTRVEPGTTI